MKARNVSPFLVFKCLMETLGMGYKTDKTAKGFHGIPERMGTIRDLSRFDAQMFGVNPKQAHLMDPQVRLLLETSYEAIMDAGYDPETLRSHNIGVFIGCSMSDSDDAFSVDTDKIDGYGLIGSSRALFSNRISYAFDFTGPSVTVDTACSSTLSALNHAVLAIRSGQCEAAIVGGCMVSLKPATSISFSRLGMLSPDGKCKSFDAQGPSVTVDTACSSTLSALNHAVLAIRSGQCEAAIVGGCMVSLKPATSISFSRLGMLSPDGKCKSFDAQADGFARSETVGVFFVQQARHARRIYTKVAHIKISADGYKSEGVSSLAKVILAMETGVIAGNLHFQRPNPDIPSLLDGTIEIVDKATPFPGGPVGVNNFGFGGTNAHVILEQVPGLDGNASVRDKKEVPRLVLLAGRTKDSLEKTIDCIEKEGPYPDSGYALLNMVGQRSAAQFPYRGYMLVPVDGSGKEVVKATTENSVNEAASLNSHEVLKQHDIDLIKMVTSENLDGGVGPLYGCLAAVEYNANKAEVRLEAAKAACSQQLSRKIFFLVLASSQRPTTWCPLNPPIIVFVHM
ncbi:hypothetical protein HPB51_005550 [Rhipicephalus microplus]|uniref:Ketosynthase family 3 (KS3) domain-containing protein n=1 Tax=Rhipicephalus microplus TaxID=6941 RepID=A0A9J6EZ89_RHIMP|nr:hypothetical protein HPB51_005550 [Rhipicephalus microplus]